MKKIINRIARYIVGIWGLTLLFLLACVFQEKNYAADAVVRAAMILFLLVTIIFFLNYFIHLIWMIQEKRKPQNLKSDLGFMVLTVLALSGYDIYKGVFVWNDFWKKIVLVIVIDAFGEIGKYIYSWEE